MGLILGCFRWALLCLCVAGGWTAAPGPGRLALRATPALSAPHPVRAYDYHQDSLILDSLREAYGQHKVLPPGYELPALRALSHYPELADVPIEFVFRKAKIAHTSQPVMGSLLRRKAKRRYRVIISTETTPLRAPGMLPHLSYNAQIGVLGHELAHTVDYLHRGFANMVGLGVRYSLSKRTVQEWENHTDRTAIRHHLGWQLLAWSESVREILEADGRGQNYLSPDQIREEMRSIPAYGLE